MLSYISLTGNSAFLAIFSSSLEFLARDSYQFLALFTFTFLWYM